VCVCVCVFMCECVKEREGERGEGGFCVFVGSCVYVVVHVVLRIVQLGRMFGFIIIVTHSDTPFIFISMSA
jgi:hypothetical protein